MSPSAITAIAIAFGISVATIAMLANLTARLPQDAPNQRSLHIRSVPRAGGYAIWAGFLPAALWFPPLFPGGFMGWMLPWLAVASISAQDDIRGVGVRVRLTAHVAAALWAASWLVLRTAPTADSSFMNVLIAIAAIALLLAWSSNLYNFMDGSDGL